MSDGLTERVARAIHDGLGGDGWAYSNYGYDETKHCADKLAAAARAAIAIALEEAATVAEAEIVPMAADLLDVGKQLAGRKIANAIRAMVKD
jgi:hypothetical protein